MSFVSEPLFYLPYLFVEFLEINEILPISLISMGVQTLRQALVTKATAQIGRLFALGVHA